MSQLLRVALVVVTMFAVPVVVAQPSGKRATCTTKVARKPWDMLTSDEKTAYIDAELCLIAAPSQSGIEGAQTRWDDLHWSHIVQTNFIHDVGQFLPWHRYYTVAHGNLLRDECDYTGPLPYWDETADAGLSTLSDASIFQADAFGGDGVGMGQTKYIADGPFANTTLHLKRLGVTASEYKIYRSLSVSSIVRGAAQSSLDTCFQISTYTAAWECWHGSPHNGGHGGTGGLMTDVVLSPGDPVFFLHHGWLDAMWWRWQSIDPSTRLTDIGGRNVPQESYVSGASLSLPGSEWTDYDGDEGNVTTLNHVLYMADIYPNVTVGDVMDANSDVVCAEYFFSDSFNVTTTTVVDGIMVTVSQ